MKHFAIAVLLLLSIISGSVNAVQTSPRKGTIEELVKSFAAAYTGKNLASLDAGKPYLKKITVVIEHSLEEKSETKTFTSLGKVDEWLKSRESEGFPARTLKELKQCKKGVCTYDFDGGILHNQLYLKKIVYGYSKGRYYIKTITLLDGD